MQNITIDKLSCVIINIGLNIVRIIKLLPNQRPIIVARILGGDNFDMRDKLVIPKQSSEIIISPNAK